MFKPIVPYSEPWQNDQEVSSWRALLVIIGYIAALIAANVLLVSVAEAMQLPQSSMAYTLLMLAVEVFVFVFTLWVLHNNGFKFFTPKALNKAGVLKVIIIYIIMSAAMMIFGLAIDHFVPDYVAPENQVVIENMVENLNPVVMFFTIVISAPFLEELLIRGLLMKYVFRNKPAIGALAAALVFAFLHMPSNLIDFTLYFILSCAITFTYWNTRRIEYPILLHLINNLVSFTLLQLQ